MERHIDSLLRRTGSQPSPLAVRDATAADEATLLAFMRQLQDAEAAICPSRRPGYEVDRWCYGQLLAQGVQVLLAEDGTIPVGFIAGKLGMHADELQVAAWRPHGHISDLFVAQAYRGTGAAQMLLTAMIDRLRGMGARRVRIAALYANQIAIKTYLRLGFEPFSMALDLALPEIPDSPAGS